MSAVEEWYLRGKVEDTHGAESLDRAVAGAGRISGSLCAPLLRSEGREDLEQYSTGLLSDLPRKNGDTIAAAIPGTNAQRLQELLKRIAWDEQAFNGQRVQWMCQQACQRRGALLVDDTGFAKQGQRTVGGSRQYSESLGKVVNCQVGVTGVYADAAVSWPVDVRLYLPQEWTADPARCAGVGVPAEVTFQTKPQIALALVDRADQWGVPCDFSVDVFGQAAQGSRRADAVLKEPPRVAWTTITWREGSKGWLRKKFLAIRVYRIVAGIRQQLGWLIGERPGRGQHGDWKYYFANFPKATPLPTMVEWIHRRFHIERTVSPRRQTTAGLG